SYSDAGKVGMMSTQSRSRYSGMFRMGRSGQSGESTARSKPAKTPETTVNKADIEYFKKASEKYKALTGIKTQPPLRDPKGTFFQYGYYQFGVLSFSTPGWGITAESDSTKAGRKPAAGEKRAPQASSGRTSSGAARGSQQKAGIDKEFLSWLDKNNKAGFINWETVEHPEFGEVEVGGFSPYAINNPPKSEIEKQGETHGKFAVWLSGLYAKVEIAKTEVIDHDGGVYRIKAEVENTGFMPTALSHGVVSRSVKPTMVQLGVDPKSIISGNAKTSFFQALAGSGSREKFEWLIKGKPGEKVELKVVAQKAGSDKVNITLK
ncbi:MAG: hypothetical protein R3182_00965, partial [Draconibacterium sp.]|nr:hypothetical protein [Draconibacterium sp.]